MVNEARCFGDFLKRKLLLKGSPKMSNNTFVCDLDTAVAHLVAESRARKGGVTAGEAVRVLASKGITVPGDNDETKAINVRSLLAWVDSSVGGNKRGPGGGFCAVEFASAKEKKAQGVVSLVNQLKEQGVTDEQIRMVLASAAANPRPVAATLAEVDG
jgi:hypothetical protein